MGGAESTGDVFNEGERGEWKHGGEVLRPGRIGGGEESDEVGDEDGFPAAPLGEEAGWLGGGEPGGVVGGRLGFEGTGEGRKGEPGSEGADGRSVGLRGEASVEQFEQGRMWGEAISDLGGVAEDDGGLDTWMGCKREFGTPGEGGFAWGIAEGKGW